MTRPFLTAALLAAAIFAVPAAMPALAAPAVQITPDVTPPMDNQQSFVEWMAKNRGEKVEKLNERWARFQAMIQNKDLWTQKEYRAFLLSPREEFALTRNYARAYEHNFLDIGYGVTISGPHLVGRMTSALDVKPGEKVLEIGTGSGYQSSLLTYLTDKVYTIEIIDAAGRAHRRHLQEARCRRLQGIRPHRHQDRRRLLRLDRSSAVRQDHRHRRHRPHPAALAAAACGRRHHGHPGRPARPAARAESGQAEAARRRGHHHPRRSLQRQDRALRALHQAMAAARIIRAAANA